MELPIHTSINSTCLWIKDSNGNELTCGYVFTHNNRDWLIKHINTTDSYIAVQHIRSSKGHIQWRNFDWIKNVAKYTTIKGYVKDPTDTDLIKTWKEFI